MGQGAGAAFFGVTLYAVLLLLAALLAAATAASRYWDRGRPDRILRYVAVGLAAVVVTVTGFGVALLADEATALAGLFVAVVALPLVAVAARQLWVGAPWPTIVARAGMAWSLPFLVGSALLFAVQTTLPAVSATVATVLAGAVTTGGALLLGEYLASTRDGDDARSLADA